MQTLEVELIVSRAETYHVFLKTILLMDKVVHLWYVTLSYSAVCRCLYLRNYCIDSNATCTKLKFAVHLLWFCINERC